MTTLPGDNTPHLAYFDIESQLSFTYDLGSEMINVSVGGYGEPVTDTFEASEFTSGWDLDRTVAQTLKEFAAICEGYLARRVSAHEIEKALVEGWRMRRESSVVTGRVYDGTDSSPRSKAYHLGLRARKAFDEGVDVS